MRRDETTETARVAVPPAVGWIALVVTLAALWVITYYTLFPFDAVAGGSITDAFRRFRLETGPIWSFRAVPANVLLFAPLGLGLAGVARWRGWSRRMTVVACTVAGGLLSTAIEVAQALWLVRMPSFDDIAANTAGAALGALVWTWGEARICRAVDRRQGRELSGRARGAIVAVGLAPLGVGLLAAAAAAGTTERLDWQPGNWLVLGNEASGDRPWSGSIAEVGLADRTLTPEETSMWLAGTPMRELAGDATLLDDRFDGSVPTGLEVEPDGSPETDRFGPGGAVEVGPEQWLQSPAPVDEISRRIAASGSFTVAVEASPASTDQSGPGRIVAVSADTRNGNLLVGQDGSDLVLRIRSDLTGANGTSPEYAVRNFFDELGPHRFTVSYDASSLRITTAPGGDTRTLDLQPATATMLGTFVDDAHRLYVSPIGAALRDVWFATFLFAPWCLSVGLLRARHGFDVVTAVLVLVPVVAAELVLAAIEPSPDLRIREIVVVGAAALLLTALVGAVARRATAAPR